MGYFPERFEKPAAVEPEPSIALSTENREAIAAMPSVEPSVGRT
jgi:hypothetical protein